MSFRPHEGDPSSLRIIYICREKTNDCFRPHEGDPSSLLKFNDWKIIGLKSFRPHEGDPSSLQEFTEVRNRLWLFPSPRRGPIFSTTREIVRVESFSSFNVITCTWFCFSTTREIVRVERVSVSVPTKGTHLLYRYPKNDRYCVELRFRPHEGDPSSLRCLFRPQISSVIVFPSPRRGPIFSTRYNLRCFLFKYIVSVPTKGTHLLYKRFVINLSSKTVSVPTKGTHLLYRFCVMDISICKGFRPHEGDPSSLQITLKISKSEYSFRPHEGDPSSLRKGDVTMSYLTRFPSPRRGPIFSTD